MRGHMTFEQLKEKARSLPFAPGVYLMKDTADRVIYVGKAKRLKNRVSQYFQDTASHTAKTRLMISKVDHFDVIVAASEFEALVLECSLIKRHQPKYNILLKDDKGYPYIRLDMKSDYPRLSLSNSIKNDGAEYFGPFGSRGVTNELIKTILLALKLPQCALKFPRDIGKKRPCLHYHINQCAGWCQKSGCQAQYYSLIEQARMLLRGNYKKLISDIRDQMLDASENLNFEMAASLRDRMSVIEKLSQKQLVTTDSFADMDVIGFAQTETKACFALLHFSNGNLTDKEYEILSYQEDPSQTVSALVKQYYISRGLAPKLILLPFAMDDSVLFEEYILQHLGGKTNIRVPQRGNNKRYVELANQNAAEEVQRINDHDERSRAVVATLAKMLGISALSRIESFDISNISGTDIVASMVVYQNGKQQKSDYRRFKIKGLVNQDDYSSMHQVVTRRFKRYLDGDVGFDHLPDLLLIDGGIAHAKTAAEAIHALSINVPVFGMVKDDRHRTRALVSSDGGIIHIDSNQSVFSFIGRVQEETHRFAISFHRDLRSKRLRYSELDEIPLIGKKRKEDLLKRYKSISAIKDAPLADLETVLPKDAAYNVYTHFKSKGDE